MSEVIDGRVPPHDLDAEAAVISACMLDSAVADDALAICRPEEFYADSHRWPMEAIVDLRRQGKPCDIVVVAEWLKAHERIAQVGGTGYLTEILDAAPVVVNVLAYARIVADKARVRALIAAARRIMVSGYFDYGDAQEFLDESAQAVMQLAEAERDDTLRPMGAIMKATRERVVAAREGGGVTGLPTGLRALDVVLGGLHPGHNVVIAARPGMGKSALGATIASQVAAANHGVLMVSAEMPGEELGERLSAWASRVSTRTIRTGGLDEKEWGRWVPGALRIGSLPMWVDDKAAPTLMHIRSKCRQVVRACATRKVPFKLLVVDYLQLLRHHGAGNREQEIAELSRGMKEIAKDFAITVLALSQLNRAVESRGDKRPMLSDLRESGSIEQDADEVAFVYRDEYYVAGRRPGVAEIIVAKHRGGPTGTVYVHFDGPTVSFRDVTDEEVIRHGLTTRAS